MSLKLTSLTGSLLVFTLVHTTWTAVITFQSEESDHHHHHHQHVPVASSYMHFHGPVEGPQFEVKVPYILPHHSEHNALGHDNEENHHHGYTLDYVAHPKYEFSYGVEDHHTGDRHSQKEVREGDSVSGEYSVQEPGGSFRVVTYKADKDGFHAVVHRKGKNDHSGATYSTAAGGGATHQDYQQEHHQQLQIANDDAESRHYEYSHDAYDS